MAELADKNRELEAEIVRLMEEVDRYRTATDDALQQLDWCIGYFVGTKHTRLAKALGSNRSHIRKHLLNRPALPVPEQNSDSTRETS